jgi:hypothetical protein
MSTKNPKVSAYIPQHIYDSFKSFYEQRGISMSQAVAVIFAEYFALDSLVDQKSSTSGLLLERVGLLEQELATLKELVQNHLQLGGMVNEKEHLVVHDNSLPEIVSSYVAEPTNVTPSEPLKDGGLPEAELPEILENMEVWLPEGDLPEITPSEAVGNIPGELIRNGDLPETESAEVESPQVLENTETPLAGGNLSEITPSQLVDGVPSELLGDGDLAKIESPTVLENLDALSLGGNLPEIIPSELVSDSPGEELENHKLSENVKPETATGQESLSYSEVPLFPIPGNSLEGIQPISGQKLSKQRFRLSQNSVSGAIHRYENAQSFIDWTRTKDPDGIGWKKVETPVPGYIPADELSSNLRSKLLEWIRNQGL